MKQIIITYYATPIGRPVAEIQTAHGAGNSSSFKLSWNICVLWFRKKKKKSLVKEEEEGGGSYPVPVFHLVRNK